MKFGLSEFGIACIRKLGRKVMLPTPFTPKTMASHSQFLHNANIEKDMNCYCPKYN